MAVKRGDNSPAGAIQATIGRVAAEDDFAAYDALGPNTRVALRESPIKVMAFNILQDLQGIGLDPKDPDIDLQIARAIGMECYKTIARDRPEIDARVSIKPLRRINRRELARHR